MLDSSLWSFLSLCRCCLTCCVPSAVCFFASDSNSCSLLCFQLHMLFDLTVHAWWSPCVVVMETWVDFVKVCYLYTKAHLHWFSAQIWEKCLPLYKKYVIVKFKKVLFYIKNIIALCDLKHLWSSSCHYLFNW